KAIDVVTPDTVPQYAPHPTGLPVAANAQSRALAQIVGPWAPGLEVALGSAPSSAPSPAFVEDPAGDTRACAGVNAVPCVPGVPRDDLDLRAAWFDSDAENLYVGLK